MRSYLLPERVPRKSRAWSCTSVLETCVAGYRRMTHVRHCTISPYPTSICAHVRVTDGLTAGDIPVQASRRVGA